MEMILKMKYWHHVTLQPHKGSIERMQVDDVDI